MVDLAFSSELTEQKAQEHQSLGPLAHVQGPRHSFERRRKPLWPGGGPLVSVVGFGAARLGLEHSSQANSGFDALKHALELGVNLIDCSAQAQDAQSEILVGRVLREVFSAHTLKRDDLVIVTKVGQLQGHAYEKHLHAQMRGGMEKWTYHYAEAQAVSFSRELIRDQILASMRNLGVNSIDCVLLECPEKFFMASVQRPLFLQALGEAFAGLGECVQEGLIKGFGVSSETLGYPHSVWNHVSLSELLSAAHCSHTRKYFRLVAMPLNWIEMTPLTSDLSESLVAEEIGLLAQRPLNALCRGRLVRLSRPQFSEQEMAAMSLNEKKALQNWMNLSFDLESVGRKMIQIPGYDDAPLSQLVVSTLAALPAVSSVLLGMRKRAYVEDALEALTRPKLLNAEDLLLEIHDQLEFDEG